MANGIGLVALLAVVGAVAAQEPKMPTPVKQHDWLKQLAGDWALEMEAVMAPGAPPMKGKGTEAIQSLGGFWSVSTLKADMAGHAMTGHMTLGYDAAAGKYVGTWVCSEDGHLWKYTGTLDAAGKTLTLETEGPNPMTGKTSKMRDAITLKGPDQKVLTSSLLGDDGKWVTFMTITATRKK